MDVSLENQNINPDLLGSLSSQTQQELLDLILRNIAVKTPNYDIWVDKINRDLDTAISRLIDNTALYHHLDETGLTGILTLQMQAMYQASSETFRNGNADISIEHNSFRWIGEAKIIPSSALSNLNYLNQGFLQLSTRYAKCQGNATQGGMIIYIKPNRNCKGEEPVMYDWGNYLLNKHHSSNITTNTCNLKPSCFYSEHTHESAKRSYKIRHMPITLHHKPQDSSGKTAKKYKN